MASNPNSNLNRINKKVCYRVPNITLPATKRAAACIWQWNTCWSSLGKRWNSYFDIWRKQGTGFWTSDTWAPLACKKLKDKQSEASLTWTRVQLWWKQGVSVKTERNSPGKHHTWQKGRHIMVRHPPTFDPGKWKTSTGRDEECITPPKNRKHNFRVWIPPQRNENDECTPGAIAHEDAFPYGQRAVVPHQQEVEDFISDSKQQ